ncbi:MAG: hypothetical protein DRJ40_00125 [Thermoprotei archaeon]|nr:MAG: hypothetical protein DRJ40_00125 [Thermoprotei archaeon]
MKRTQLQVMISDIETCIPLLLNQVRNVRSVLVVSDGESFVATSLRRAGVNMLVISSDANTLKVELDLVKPGIAVIEVPAEVSRCRLSNVAYIVRRLIEEGISTLVIGKKVPRELVDLANKVLVLHTGKTYP